MNIPGFSKKPDKGIYTTPNDKRPVRLIEVSENVWHVVYAD